jgi:hypothetical protein
VILTLASGRSGTSFLADFFKKNAHNCYSTHEPYFTYGNPTLFGKTIDWNATCNDEKLLPLLEKKQQFINACKQPVYIEANHALLKSAHRHIALLFDNVGFIHLVRNPKLVAKSELLREELIRKTHIPFCEYTSDAGERFFRWSLTGKESIFQHFKQPLSRFQFYLLQWLEIEYRAMRLITQNHYQNRVFFIDVEKQLKQPEVLEELCRFFAVDYTTPLNMQLKSNRTPFVGPTILSAEEEHEWRFIVKHLPDDYFNIFQSAPYDDCEFTQEWLFARE